MKRLLITAFCFCLLFSLDLFADSVRWIDILVSPEKFTGREITIGGKFDTKYTYNKTFTIMQGDYDIDVSYADLNKEVISAVLSEHNYSGTYVTVTGKLRMFSDTDKYYIRASDVQGLSPDHLYKSEQTKPKQTKQKHVGKVYSLVGNVYSLRTSKDYHSKDCSVIDDVELDQLIKFRSITEARKLGATPCELCRP